MSRQGLRFDSIGVIKKQKSEFEPSMRILSRIIRVLLEKNSIGRTHLAQATNLHYGRLTKYLAWLENRSFIVLSLENGKTVVKFTSLGREFSQKLTPNSECI